VPRLAARPVLAFAFLLLAGVAAITACGGDDDASQSLSPEAGPGDERTAPPRATDGGAAPIGPKEACVLSIEAYCARSAECGRPFDCSGITALCPDYFFSEGSTYTLESLLACVAERRAQPCDELQLGISPRCATPGALEAGAPCRFTPQCASSDCSTEGGGCGVCGALRAPDSGCPVVGESCGLHAYCPSEERGCVSDVPPSKAIGAACVAGDSCAWPASCQTTGADASTGSCIVNAEGGPCGVSAGGEGATCSFGLRCVEQSSARTCRPAPEAGDFCGAAWCKKGFYCAGGTTCTARGELGQACSFQALCKEGLSCAPGPSGNVCSAGASLGEGCGQTWFDDGGAVEIACAVGKCTYVTMIDGGETRVCFAGGGGIGDPCAPPQVPCQSPLVCGADGQCALERCPVDAGPASAFTVEPIHVVKWAPRAL
jgi:hypothetical protein